MLEFTVPRPAFADAAAWAARIISVKPLHPVLGGVRITATAAPGDVRIRFSAYDTETSAEADVTAAAGAFVAGCGEALVSGRLLAALARILPRAESVEARVEGPVLHLACGRSEFTLPLMAAAEFPELPALPEDTAAVDAGDLAAAIARVVPAAHTDPAVPYLCAVHLEATSETTLTLFATDRHRVAMAEVPWCPADGTSVGRSLLVPSAAVGEAARLDPDDQGSVFLGLGDGALLGVHGADRRTTTRLIDHPFPDCRAIFPSTHATVARVDAALLAESMARAALVDDDEYPRVRLAFIEGTGLELRGGRDDIGGFRETVDGAQFTGAPCEVWVNPRYLADALAGTGGKALLGLDGPKRPVAVTADEGAPLEAGPDGRFEGLHGSYLHLIMPTTGAA